MKLNWGAGIVIGMVLFISFIMFFVTKMMTDKKYDYDLVTEQYYQKEMVYQQEIDEEQNAQSLPEQISGEKTDAGWLLHFPASMSDSMRNGTVFLYRTSNKKLDFSMPVSAGESNILIPKEKLLPGRWNITLEWQSNDKRYLYKKAIIY
ncbi:MAG: FixH family protein [Gillisia sp.]